MISSRPHTLIIAEAGVNHNGSMEMAKQLIDVAADAKVDFVKFQTFKASSLVSTSAPKADYQKKEGATDNGAEESQFQMLKKLELSESDHYELIEYCARKNIRFLSTAFDLESLDFLKLLGIELFKIPSGEVTNLPYLEKVAEIAGSIILSTGMCTMTEIEQAIRAIREKNMSTKITVLHCNTEYPTPFADVNLLAMNSIADQLGVDIGYSDHTLGIEIPIASVALGAKVVEKHFTLDRNLPGPDHAASLEPSELKEMVRAIRNIELALGQAEKKPSPSEVKNMAIARKSIHLAVPKAKGDTIQVSDLAMLRPGDGISPMRIYEISGCIAARDLPQGHKLQQTDLEVK